MPLDKEDIERLKEIFVTQKECEHDMQEARGHIADSATRLSVIETQLKLILWLLAAVGGGVITMLIKMFWGA